MSGLVNEEKKGVIFLNIKEGKLVSKKENGETESFDGVRGTLIKIEFVKDEYEGRTFEKARIMIKYQDDVYLLQMKLDSGYFRGFCNSLKSGNPKEEIYIKPSLSKDEQGRNNATCFVKQGNSFLKHAYTKNNMGDLPELKVVNFGGKTLYDNTEQVAFWKNWLDSVINTKDNESIENNQNIEESSDFNDDLPF
jgi:hypothetical protein